MGSPRLTGARPRIRRRLTLAATGVLVLLATAACSADTPAGRLGVPPPASEEAEKIVLPMWQNAWIAAWIVGGITWGLMLYAAFRYRRRPGDGLPKQTRYHLPLEALYTFTPVVIVLVLTFYSVRDTNDLTELTDTSTHTVGVVGYKWAWGFNYVEEGAHDIGTPEVPATLWMPVDERARFQLTSPDVIHSFWVPAFLFKLDVMPGMMNQFELTPNKVGEYAGRCAELCGVDHSRMLFRVKVVPRADYDAHIADLKAHGQGGLLDTGRAVTTGVAK